MASALDSNFGLARQTSRGSVVSNDANFEYFYFSRGDGISPRHQTLPLEQEIGSGPLIRDVSKVGLVTGGESELVPRPNSIGHALMGLLGDVQTVDNTTHYTHTFKFASDAFETPYYTFRRRVGALGAEIFPDVKFQSLVFDFRGANYLRATLGLVGISEPSYATGASWDLTNMDSTPPFLTCKGSFELPSGQSLKMLRGTLAITNGIPMEEQVIIGSYTPDDAEMVTRAIVIQGLVKADRDLYEKMMYNPQQDGTWQPELLYDADMSISFETARNIDGAAVPYKISFHANGQNQASGNGNVTWSVQPVALVGNRQVTMNIQGVILADTTSYADGPFSAQLVNSKSSY